MELATELQPLISPEVCDRLCQKDQERVAYFWTDCPDAQVVMLYRPPICPETEEILLANAETAHRWPEVGF